MHSGTKHAVSQVEQYLRGVAHDTGLPIERLAGCAFDGTWIIYVTAKQNEWHVQRPVRVDADALRVLVDTLESLSAGRGLTTANLEEDFGRDSATASRVVNALVDSLTIQPSPRTSALFHQWERDIGSASGFGPTSSLPDWQQLCGALSVPSEPMVAAKVLFALQTYFALVARLFAVVVLEGVTGQRLMDELQRGSIWIGLHKLESGELTQLTFAANVIEPGIFSWYASERGDALQASLEALVIAVSEYSAEVVEITPLVARDVFKGLYQRLVPRAIRHRLGEYYTPDWLAGYVVDLIDTAESPLSCQSRVLDPACGSGTFLVEVLSRVIDRASDRPPSEVLALVTRNVVGFDLSPLAVQAARVNYLLAIAPILRKARALITLPVFLADSVSPPRRGGLFERDVLKLRTAEGEWRVPVEISDASRFARVGTIFAGDIESGKSFNDSLAHLREQMPELPWGEESFPERLEALLAKLADIERSGRNGMWWNLIANALAPTFEEPFDAVVGNPPWVSWETLPEEYRNENEDLWQLYRLHPDIAGSRRQRSDRVRLDLSMLFVAVSVDRYLNAGGKLAFLITSSVFQSELAGRGFRGRVLPLDSEYSFTSIEDLGRLNIFDDASNRASILTAERSAPTSKQIPTTIWSGNTTSTVPEDATLEEALDLVTRRTLAAEPVDPRDILSPLLIMSEDALRASYPLRRRSPYSNVIREGINTRGGNGILFVDILERDRGSVRIRNDPSRGRIPGLPTVEAIVEEGSVASLVRGEDVSPGIARPRSGVLFFHDAQHTSKPMSEAEAAHRFPRALEFAKEFRPFLQRRRRFRNFDPSGSAWLGLYSVTAAVLASHKVVVREIASDLVAAPLDGAGLVPDHKLYVIPCQSADEARRLSRVLNDDLVRAIVRSFSIKTSLTGSFLTYVGIRNLRDHNGDESSDEWLATALGISVFELNILRRYLFT